MTSSEKICLKNTSMNSSLLAVSCDLVFPDQILKLIHGILNTTYTCVEVGQAKRKSLILIHHFLISLLQYWKKTGRLVCLPSYLASLKYKNCHNNSLSHDFKYFAIQWLATIHCQARELLQHVPDFTMMPEKMFI